jgi:hypothetical protein
MMKIGILLVGVLSLKQMLILEEVPHLHQNSGSVQFSLTGEKDNDSGSSTYHYTKFLG